MTVDFAQKRLRLIGKKRKAHIFAVDDIHLLTDDQINALRKRQDPVVRVIAFGDFALFIDEQRHVVQLVLGDELAVRFGRIARESQDFYFSGFVFSDVLLKLNKLANSGAGVVFGIKGQHHGFIVFERFGQRPHFAVLIGQRKVRGFLTGRDRVVSDVRIRAGGKCHKRKHKNDKSVLFHKPLLSIIGFLK